MYPILKEKLYPALKSQILSEEEPSELLARRGNPLYLIFLLFLRGGFGDIWHLCTYPRRLANVQFKDFFKPKFCSNRTGFIYCVHQLVLKIIFAAHLPTRVVEVLVLYIIRCWKRKLNTVGVFYTFVTSPLL